MTFIFNLRKDVIMNQINDIPDDIPMDEILEKIDASFNYMDSERTDGLDRLKTIQRIKNRASHRERIRLIDKYSSDHIKVKNIDTRLRYNVGLMKELTSEIERSKIKIPKIDKNTWMVHGFIANENDISNEGLTVSLYDESYNWIKELGFACTNEKGYFAIVYKVKERQEAVVTEDQKVILTVSDKEYKILYQDKEPLYVKLGEINYRIIVIPKIDEVCTPPQPDNSEPIPPDAWVVRGKVVDENDQGIAGLTISLYDKDLLFDDVLGTTVTDDNGNFKFIYRTEAFRNLFEKKPDIYLKVLNAKGETLYSSKKAVRCNVEREEYFEIKIRRK